MNIVNGRYEIAGADVLSICDEFDTPLYVYDADTMKNRFLQMQNAFSYPDLKINYACKANTNYNILKLFRSLGSGVDTVSIQEVMLALDAGFHPSHIIYTPNCVSMEEYRMAVVAGVNINIDNISMLDRFGSVYGSDVPVCIRINPHIMAGGNQKISVGHIDSKFGISIHQVPLVKRIIAAHNMKVEGLHMHTGSDILDVEVFLQGVELLLQTAFEFKELKYIDFGSGFKVAYKPDDIETNIEEFGRKVSERFSAFCDEYGKHLTLMFEPGKYLVSEAGYFFVKVNVIKQTTSTIFAGVDSGMNHLIRPMFYDSYHRIVNVSKPESTPRIYSVVGYICETDTFGYNRKIQEISEGDILGFYNAGAYCYAMSSNYNSRYRPAEALIVDGKAYLIRKREKLEDLTRNEIKLG